jgi:type IV pilus assembly protein PilY1
MHRSEPRGRTEAIRVTSGMLLAIWLLLSAPVALANVSLTLPEGTTSAEVSLDDLFAGEDGVLGYFISGISDPSGIVATAGTNATHVVLTFVSGRTGTAVISVSPGINLMRTETIEVTIVRNSAPFASAAIPDFERDEGGERIEVRLEQFFDDADIPFGDALTFGFSIDYDLPAWGSEFFSSVHLSPPQNRRLVMELASSGFGGAHVTVTATDLHGASVDQTFLVTVHPLPGPLSAVDDAATVQENSASILIDVLANDSGRPDEPLAIVAAGTTWEIDGQTYPNSTQGEPTTIFDPQHNPVRLPNGIVTIENNRIRYRPKTNFHGSDFFTYTIENTTGQQATATVRITVTHVNNPPVGVQLRTFNVLQDNVLNVPADGGLLAGAYDVDGMHAGADGEPVGGTALYAVLATVPLNGTLVLDSATGAFRYSPMAGFVGDDVFTYRLSDGMAVSEGAPYEVRISVHAQPPAPPPPPPGQVATPYNLSQAPLEQVPSVPANVLVVMDDSGSMDWGTLIADDFDSSGRFWITNAGATPSVRSSDYAYLFALPTNNYPPSSQSGRVLPTQEALDAHASMSGNPYGVWRGWNHKHNVVYYNPEIRYAPWIGLDRNNVPFPDANPSAIRLIPMDPSSCCFNILAPHSYTASDVPNWGSGGSNIAVTYYIPHYFATSATPPIPHNAPREKIEIRPGRTFPGGPMRLDCAVGDDNPHVCTYDQEIQNFANWFAYYRNREYVTKASIGSVVAGVQDMRVGYMTINNQGRENIRHMNDDYTTGNKRRLLDNIYSVESRGGSPLRQALDRAGNTFRGTFGGMDDPLLPAPDGMCQQNFALLFSDGYWSGGSGVSSNADANTANPFDGGRYADPFSATLADTAMFYYKTDLRPQLENLVPVGPRDILGAPPGTFEGENPRMHQHMKTFAIAFGQRGTINPADIPRDPTQPFNWPDPFSGTREKLDDLVHAALNGRGSFVNTGNPLELQAAFQAAFLEFAHGRSSVSSVAFNSTSLQEGTLLFRGFFDLRYSIGDLTATEVQTTGPNAGQLAEQPRWSASAQLSSQLPDGRVIVTFDPQTWRGIPFRHSSLNTNQQQSLTVQQLQFLRGDRSQEGAGGLRERHGLLGDIVNSAPIFVGKPPAANRDQRPFPTTDLYSDFVLAQADRTPVVYVGANDGMFHGFDAETGRELFAYVPNMIIDPAMPNSNKLADFTGPFYAHRYYVDLSARLNDVYMRPHRDAVSRQWNTVLVGGLGAGGKGYFALNVTNPSLYTSESAARQVALWEFTDEDDTYPTDSSGIPLTDAEGNLWTDALGRPAKDLGYATGEAIVTMSNVDSGGPSSEKEWVTIFGNGFNASSGIAKLFVLFMERGLDGWSEGDFVKLDTGVGVPGPGQHRAGFPNGLGEPVAIDASRNGTVDYVYAGDMLGNLYRFDLTASNPADWKVTRLFTARDPDGLPQPITKRPTVVKHPDQPGFIVMIGTGSLVTTEDAADTQIQSVYGIWDRFETAPATASMTGRYELLVQQTVTNVLEELNGELVTRRVLSDNPVVYEAQGGENPIYGWWFDVDPARAGPTSDGRPNPDTQGHAPPAPQFPGERAIRRFVVRNGVTLTTTVLPSTGEFSCFGVRPGAIMLWDAFTGGNPQRQVIDFNRDGSINEGDMVLFDGRLFAGGLLFNQGDLDGALVDLSTLGGEGDLDWLFISGGATTETMLVTGLGDTKTGRLSWRELDN